MYVSHDSCAYCSDTLRIPILLGCRRGRRIRRLSWSETRQTLVCDFYIPHRLSPVGVVLQDVFLLLDLMVQLALNLTLYELGMRDTHLQVLVLIKQCLVQLESLHPMSTPDMLIGYVLHPSSVGVYG